MSILKRFTNIMSYNARSLFNKSNNPMKEINDYLITLDSDLGILKSETEANEVNKNRLRRELDDCEENIYKFDRYIQKATENGKVRDAKIYLAKKEELMPRYNSLKEAYDISVDKAEKMQELHSKLVNDIAVLKSRLDEANLGKTASSIKTGEVADKLDNMIYTAEALEELNNPSNKDDDLDAEFEKLLKEDN